MKCGLACDNSRRYPSVRRGDLGSRAMRPEALHVRIRERLPRQLHPPLAGLGGRWVLSHRAVHGPTVAHRHAPGQAIHRRGRISVSCTRSGVRAWPVGQAALPASSRGIPAPCSGVRPAPGRAEERPAGMPPEPSGWSLTLKFGHFSLNSRRYRRHKFPVGTRFGCGAGGWRTRTATRSGGSGWSSRTGRGASGPCRWPGRGRGARRPDASRTWPRARGS